MTKFDSVTAVLSLWTARAPERTAYVFLAEGEEEQDRLTYAALDARARAVTAALSQSCRPGERALLLYPPGLDFIAAFFGCLYAGVIAVPAYPPRSPRLMPRLLAILADAKPAIALASAASLQRVRGWLERTPAAAALSWIATDEIDPAPAGWEPAAPEGDAVAFLQYTSGSTSAPKGVMVTQANLAHNQRVIQQACGHSEESVFVSWLPPYHDLGLIGNLLQATWVGAPCVLMAPAAFLQSPSRWLRAVSRYHGTTSGGPNFAYDLCVRRMAPAEIERLDLSSWRVAFNGAEPVREGTLARFAEAFAPAGFRASSFYPCYGLAEATLMVSGGRLGEEPVVREIGGRRLVSCGRVLADLSVAIVDSDSGAPRGPGAVGEIWVAGGSVAPGYWNRPEETAQAFGAVLPDGRGPWLRTGDLGAHDGGELFVAGRLKDLIILRGRNHYPQDIELTAELSHPALQPGSTAAFAVEIEGQERLAVVVERRPRSRSDGDGIDSVAPAVRRAVAEEHEVQVHAVVLVPPGTVLKTSSGKVQRRACRDLFLAGHLETLGVSLAGEEEASAWTGEAPRAEDLLALDETARPAAVAAYLRQEAGRALKMDPSQVPERQPLTSLGLDSLAAVELEQRVAEGLGVELPASGLLEGASLDDLAERILASLPMRAAAPRPLPAAGTGEAPLSAMQKALWFEQQLAPESPAYNIPFAVRLDAGADIAALRRVLAILVGRHAALRSTVAVEAGRPVQRFAREADLSFAMRDVSGAEELRAAVSAEAHRPFDLERGPLFRAVLFTGVRDERVLLLVAHHLVFDGWSLWVLLDELRLLDAAAHLPAPAAEYADFVRWQEEMVAGPAGERLWGLWRAELSDGMPPLQLPADRQVAARTWTGAVHRFPVDSELVGRLRRLARREGTTLYAVLLATFQTLLSRSTGQLEVVVGTAVSGRSRPEFRDLVGCLFNAVPLKADLAADPSFGGLVRQVRGRLAAALARQDYPSHLLAERLRPGWAAGGAPFFEAQFLYQKPHRGAAAPRLLSAGDVQLDLGSLVLDVLFVDQVAARSGLELEVFEADDGVAAWFRYSTELFDAATVERLARHLTALLREAAQGDDRPVSELPLLDAAERDLLLREWSRSGKEYPAGAAPEPIHELFAEQAARTPDKTAAVCRGEALLYRELDEQAGRLAGWLLSLDGGSALIGLMVEPDHPLLVGMLGILKAGKGFVPLDPDIPAERLERMIADCDLAVLATDRRHLARAQEVARRCPSVAHLICLDDDADCSESSPPGPLSHLPPPPPPGEGEPPSLLLSGFWGSAGDGTAYVIFTSGSTGVPKGVPITHENLVPLLLWSREVFGFGEHTRVLQSLSYAFDFGVFEILTTLLFGGTLVLRGGSERSDVEGYLEEIRRHRINTLHTTPSFFRAVAGVAADAGERLDSLEVLHLGGEALGEGLVAEAFAVTGEGCRLFNGYGPTEAAVNCALYEVGRAADWRPRGLASVPIGRPSAANRLYGLDRRMQPVPVGVPGELFVGGVGLSRGYLDQPQLTAARFVPDPFDGLGGRLYRTGDLVRFHDDGAIEFLGRVDNQVKVRGYRIELEEIEAALAALEGVRQAVVVAWSSDGSDRGDLRLVAYVAGDTTAEELRRSLREPLPSYMVPSAFVLLPDLPLNASGKVDRLALPEPSFERAAGGAAPRTAAEELVAGICAEVLGLGSIGIHDDLFELGCHSLLATKIVARVRETLRVELSLHSLFNAPTVAGLAAAARTAAAGVELPPVVPVVRDRDLPLSFPQERIWFLHKLEPRSVAYNVPRALAVRGRLDVGVLERVFTEIVRRHEILRTTFEERAGGPVQIVHAPWRFTVPLIDLRQWRAPERDAWVARFIVEEGRTPFDLGRGPLIRVKVLRLADDEHVMVTTEHHLVHDGWTQGVLIRDFLALYAAFSRGSASPLPELPVQYADFAVWQRQWLHGELLDRQIAFWRQALAGAPALSGVLTDRPRPRRRSAEGRLVTRPVPIGLANSLRALSRRLGTTLFMTLLAAFDTLLWRSGAQDDLPVGTVLANRRVREIEGLLGMILNTLVLRVKLAGEPGFDELARRAREVCLAAYEHQDAPIEKLVEVLQPARSLSYTPLFQVLFSFLDTPTSDLTLPGLELRLLDSHNQSAKFDLNVTAIPHSEQRIGGSVNVEGSEIAILWEYSTDLYEPATIERLARHYLHLLAGLVADPGCRISELPLLDAAEQAELLAARYPVWPAYPRERCIHELVAEQAAFRPVATALVCGGETVSYGELDSAANRLARRLVWLGAGPDERVAVCLERSPGLIVALLATLKAGSAYLPLDLSSPRERLAGLLADGGARILVTEERLLEALPPAPGLRTVCLDAEEAALAAESPEPLPARAVAESLAYVLFTSGSTGRPKGVAVPHRAVVRLVRQSVFARLGEDEVLVQSSPVTFDASTLEIWGSLANGARLVVPPPQVLSLGKLGELLEGHGVTLAFLTTGLFNQMAEAELPRLQGVRQLLTGGEAASTVHFRRVVERLGDRALIHVYGPTESTTFATCHWLDAASPVGTSVPIGGAIAHTRVHLLDSGYRPVPVGVPGEIWIGGDGLARGYLGRPDLTAERFVPDPLPPEQAGEPGGRLYRTGDLARWLPDGALDFLGRIDHQVKLRGFRIEPGEIEAALCGHPAVAEAVVAVRGEGTDRRLVAWVVPAGAARVDAGRLRAFLGELLPDYMIPAGFVPVPFLPLTAHGKVDRRALLALEEPEVRDAAAWTPPRTPVEEVLAGLWAELLGVERVGIDDDFFGLGGHSLIATRAISRLRDLFGLELPLQDLFEAPSVAGLSARIEAALAEEGRPEMAVPRPTPGEPVLSFAQQRLWFLDQLQPGGSDYNLPGVFRLRGDLAVAPLARGLSKVAHRHEALRTVFPSVDGRPLAVVRPAAEVPLPVIDLAALPARSRGAEVGRLAAVEARRPFDLATGPVLRAGLLRLAAAEHVLLLTLHHIAADGWSAGVLTRELAALYGAFSRGEPTPLPPLPLQYGDFARWQRGWLTQEVLEAQLGYWREQLRGAPATLELPTDRPRPAGPAQGGARLPFAPAPELAGALAAAGRREGATPFMLLLAAFQAVLSRWSGSEDVCVGSPVANRRFSELEGLIGFFVNTLVLRTDLAGDPDVRGLLRRVRAMALGGYAHQDVPFERLVQELAPDRGPGRQPLFQVMLAPLDGPLAPDLLGSLTLEPLPTPGGAAKFDLTLYADLGPGHDLAGVLEYRPELFDRTTAQRFLAHLETLLTGVLASPERRLADLPLLSAAERGQLIEWGTGGEVTRGAETIPALFAAQAARTPQATAVVGGGERLIYGELAARADALAAQLRRLGIGPESTVGVCMGRSPKVVAALLGVLEAGAAYVPLDPAYPAERLAFMLADSGAAVVLTDASSQSRVPPGVARVLPIDAALAGGGRAAVSYPAGPGNLAYVIYTSGSTGRPKGVAIEHASAAAFLTWAGEVFAAELREGVLASTSICFDLSIFEIFGPLCHGGRVILAADALELAVLPAAAEVGLINTVPSAMAELLRMGAVPPSVRTVNLAGEPLPGRLVRQIHEETAAERVLNLYGPSEDTTYSLFAEVGRDEVAPPIGRPVAGTHARVAGPRGELLPAGVAGELLLSGAGLARGYLRRPDLTAERFVPDPWSDEPGARLYRTGDLVRFRRNGELEFLGRIDHQVKVRGFRIELGEIETALREHPAVVEAAVVADGAGSDRRLVACVVADPHPPGLAAELRQSLAARLPDHMMPAAMTFLDALPRTPNGKLDRGALARLAGAQEPELTGVYAAPRTPVEDLLAQIWSDLLGLRQVGIHDNFFDLGGHSLKATQLRSRVRASLGVDLPLRSFFEAPTIARLAGRLEQERRTAGEPAAPILPVPRGSGPGLPLSFAQQRLWFLDQLEPGSPLYNIAQGAELTGRLDPPAVARSFGEIVRRHETLRTTFVEVAGQPAQAIAPALDLALPVLDLSALSPALRDGESRRLSVEEARRPFDLTRGPLLRTTLVRLAERHHLLLLIIHHIVSDGWSMGVLLGELSALYAAFAGGGPSPLPGLPVQYADFAHWQRHRLQGEVLGEQLAYWKTSLTGVPGLELPTDRPRKAVETFRGAQRKVALSGELTAAVQALSRREGTTLFMTLLAAFKALLLRTTGRPDLPVGSPIANRNRAEIEGLIGFFANTLVLRTDLSGHPTFRELLGRVRETTLGGYAHEELPFEKLVEELQPERDMSRNPLFQVMCVLQNQPWPALRLHDLELRPFQIDSGTAKFDLTLFWREQDGGLTGWLEHNSDLFDGTTARRLYSHFEALLAAALDDPERRITALPLLGEAERHQILREWSGAAGDRSGHQTTVRCVHHWVEEQVARTPGAPAVVDGDRTLTYAELDERANRLARGLARRGVRPEALAGICVERSLEMVVAALAVLKAGGALVALDPAYPRERLATIIDDARLAVLLTQESLLQHFPQHAGIALLLERGADPFPDESAENPGVEVDLDHPIYAIYTSGSTGQPKGILVTHRAFASLLAWQLGDPGLRPGARTVQLSTFGFCVSFQEMFSSWCSGGVLVVADEMTRRDLTGLAGFLEEQEIDRLHLPFAALKHLAEAAAAEAPERRRLPSRLRAVITAGEQLQVTPAVRALFELLPACTLSNQYGASETHVVSALTLSGDPSSWPAIPPAGRPIANVRIHLLDGELAPVPIGVAGELFAGGACPPRGYLNDPVLTAQKLVPDPYSSVPGVRLYRTGDAARYLADGLIEYHGRIDTQVKIRGFRVELGEIETVLRRHPDVRDAAVIAHPGPEGSQRLVAYLVLRGEEDAVEGVRGFLKDKLPEYMVPAALMVLPALPVNANGKLDREALPVPELARPDLAAYVAPRSAVEAVLAQIWTQLLGIERVGVDDNFFQLGGHSLLATQLASRVRGTLQAELPLRAVFESPTVAELAQALVSREPKPGRTEKLARLLQTVQAMPAQEVQAELSARKSAGGRV